MAVRKHTRPYIAAAKRLFTSAKIVAVTGSSTKTTTSLLVGDILSRTGRTQVIAGRNRYNAAVKSLLRLRPGDQFMVVEAAAGNTDFRSISSLLKPDVAIVTMVALEHKTYFRNLENVAAEKGDLVASIRKGGFAVLNADDPHVMTMATRTKARAVTFSAKGAEADYRVVGEVTRSAEGKVRFAFSVRGGPPVEVQTQFIGVRFVLPVIAATAAAMELGAPLNDVLDAVQSFHPLLERGGTIKAPGGPLFILDTYKCPWHSLETAFEMIRAFPASRRRIVLGHISDSHRNNDKTYRDAYKMARNYADQVIFVGEHTHRSKAPPRDVAADIYLGFAAPQSVFEYLRATAIPGEVILLKGNGELHLERIAVGFVQEITCWETKCKVKDPCFDCKVFWSDDRPPIGTLSERPNITFSMDHRSRQAQDLVK